ncbi:hypothetical protein AB4Z50_25775 [Paenibacillus sp. 2TAB26]|uniref:hypothetical protein n=1 Tax=Paenibacillus sp. 2TAB26 TaxID=3233005 RepID=UPI003F94563A
MEATGFPYQQDLKQLVEGEKIVLYLAEKAYIVQLATDEELEKINQGFFIMT